MNLNFNAESIIKQTLAVKLAILIGAIIVLVAVCFQVFYRPVFDEKKNLTPELAKLKAELSQKRDIVKEKPKYEAELKETRQKLSLALKQLPDKSEIPSLLENISSLGKASGLQFLMFKPNAEVPKAFYAEIPVDLQIQGNYQDILRFFDGIANMPRIVNITDINMASPKKVAAGTMQLVTTCKATTFKFIEGAQAK